MLTKALFQQRLQILTCSLQSFGRAGGAVISTLRSEERSIPLLVKIYRRWATRNDMVAPLQFSVVKRVPACLVPYSITGLSHGAYALIARMNDKADTPTI